MEVKPAPLLFPSQEGLGGGEVVGGVEFKALHGVAFHQVFNIEKKEILVA